LDSNSNKNNNEKSPYEILGVKEGASFEDIQKARDIKVKEAGEDLILKAKIESSFDQLLMGSLKARQSGNVSYEAVSASKKEKQINQFTNKEKIKWNIIQTPMFLNSREDFKKYLSKSKKPFMATFYKDVRKKSGILMGADGNPTGGKWSFDEDNRNKLPKNISIPKFPKINETSHTKKLKPIVEKLFKNHPGSTKNFWFATEHNDVLKLLNFFIKEKSNLFGDYEDAVDQKDNILFHSALSPYVNLGLITPEFIIKKILE